MKADATAMACTAWDAALRTMKVGEVVVIYLQDRSVCLWKHWVPTGYPEETLTFEVELVACRPHKGSSIGSVSDERARLDLHLQALLSFLEEFRAAIIFAFPFFYLLAFRFYYGFHFVIFTSSILLFPNLDKVIFLDDDIVIQRDLSPLWDINLSGKVNGAVKTCKGEDEWVMSKRFRNYFNFSHPIIAKNLNPENCAWTYGMNIFDLRAWRKKNITNTYHSWLKENLKSNLTIWKLGTLPPAFTQSKPNSLVRAYPKPSFS
ncbi:hypothetical protein MTR67_001226 [Solanum verrucosum]|uniref:Hexosyltransferase n=1 Tax=Solanum verrucosum TaxID=315347 RepID=A0AAF0PSE8_SOLVR|nr:hypothetical protein MTR67_001226 [Solanum verrucosum]